MHVLFVHRNFPAQFGHIAKYLIGERGWRCTFVSETPAGNVDGIRKIQYRTRGGATEQTHYFSRTFENATWHAAAVYEAVKPLREVLKPDLIVSHSGFGSTLFLPELWPDAALIDYFEYFYHPHHSDMDYRKEWPVAEADVLRARTRNAMILLDLEYCDAGYSPTEFQRSLMPPTYANKLRVLHDGIDTSLWYRRTLPERRLGQLVIPPDTRIVTYCSRGFESMRGFDIFMRVAKMIYQVNPDVLFLIVGSDHVHYGGDTKHIKEKTFKEYVLAQDHYDPSKFVFLGTVPPSTLAQVFSLSDLHVYLTVPFVLSWSMLDAMACACTILGSDTAPVREFIRHNENGLLADFYDVDRLAAVALDVLRDPEAFRDLGRAAEKKIHEHYGMDVIMPKMLSFYEEVVSAKR
ncbi:MAG: glycosyltransferase [Actinomycetota bacterium]